MCFALTWPSRVVLRVTCERPGLPDLLKPKVGRMEQKNVVWLNGSFEACVSGGFAAIL